MSIPACFNASRSAWGRGGWKNTKFARLSVRFQPRWSISVFSFARSASVARRMVWTCVWSARAEGVGTGQRRGRADVLRRINVEDVVGAERHVEMLVDVTGEAEVDHPLRAQLLDHIDIACGTSLACDRRRRRAWRHW